MWRLFFRMAYIDIANTEMYPGLTPRKMCEVYVGNCFELYYVNVWQNNNNTFPSSHSAHMSKNKHEILLALRSPLSCFRVSLCRVWNIFHLEASIASQVDK